MSNKNFKLFITILLTLFIPTIYKTLRVIFLSNIPNNWGFNIASQLQWVNIMFEVLQEALVLPLFFLIGSTITNTEKTKEKIVTSIFFTFILIAIFSFIVGQNTNLLTRFMSQKPELVEATVMYIRLELIAIISITLYKVSSIILIQTNKIKFILKVLALETILTIIFDLLFIGNKGFGLNLGVNGIAYTNIIIQTLLFIIIFNKILQIYEIKPRKILTYLKISSIKKWIKVGSISGLESFVRNLAFLLMIIKMINQIGEQGSFWVMMNFMWGWVLIPILALGEVIKSEASQTNRLDFKQYIKYTTLIVALWIVSIPFWKLFLGQAMGLQGEFLHSVLKLSYISIIFYIIFAYNNIIDSYFYGIGRTDLMLYQSLFVNIVFYGTAYVLFRLNFYEPTLFKITIMFGTGMAIDSIFTFIQYFRYIKPVQIESIS